MATFRGVSGTNGGSGTSTATPTLQLGFAQTSGDTLLVAVACSTGISVNSITDTSGTSGNAYSKLVRHVPGNGLGPSEIWMANGVAAAAANANTITVHLSAADTFDDIVSGGYGAFGYVPTFIGSATGQSATTGSGGQSTTASTSTSSNTNAANDLAVCFGQPFDNFTAAGTGFTSRLIETSSGTIWEDQTVAAGSTAITGTGTVSSANGWSITMVMLGPAVKIITVDRPELRPPTDPARIIVGGPLPSSGRILQPIDAKPRIRASLEYPQLLHGAGGGVAIASGSVLQMPEHRMPETPVTVGARGSPLPAPAVPILTHADHRMTVAEAAALVRGSVLPAAGAIAKGADTTPPPTDPAQLLRGGARATSTPVIASAPTRPPDADVATILRGTALPSSASALIVAPSVPPPTDRGAIIQGSALPSSGAALLAAGPAIPPPTEPGSILQGGTLPASTRILVGSDVQMGPALTAALLFGAATSAPAPGRILAGTESSPPAAPAPALLSAGALPSPGRIGVPTETRPPPTDPASIISAVKPPAAAIPALQAASTVPPPTVPGAIVTGSPLPKAGAILAMPHTSPPLADVAQLFRGAAATVPGVIIVAPGTLPPDVSQAQIMRALAATSPVVLLVAGDTRVVPPDQSRIVQGSPLPAGAFVTPSRFADPLPNVPASLLTGSVPPRGGALLVFPAARPVSGLEGSTAFFQSAALILPAALLIDVWVIATPIIDLEVAVMQTTPNNTLFATCTLRDPVTRNLLDPSSIAAFLHQPDGSTIALTVQRQQQGVYTATSPLTQPGEHFARFSGQNGGLPFQMDREFLSTPPAF